jgi:hypothetical protein
METSSVASVSTISSGKSAQSIGHQAKQSVAEARSAGIDLPKNAQGFAASSISQGVDPSSLFAAITATDEAVDVDKVGADAPDEAAVEESDAANSEPVKATVSETESAEKSEVPAFDDPAPGTASEASFYAVSLSYSTTLAVLSQPATQTSGETALALLDTRV